MNKQNINQQLRRSFFVLAIVGALTVGAALTLPTAHAATPVSASGYLTDCECVTGNVAVGRNTITTLSIKANFTGTFTGTWVGTERDVNFPEGSVTIHASGKFTGTVAGKSGTAVLTYIGEAGKASPAGSFGSVGSAVTWVVDQGTGGLAGLHGHGTFTLLSFATGAGCSATGCDFTFTLVYSGKIQFAP